MWGDIHATPHTITSSRQCSSTCRILPSSIGDNSTLHQLIQNASDKDIMVAESCTLKLTNQKNRWKGMYINQNSNEEKGLSLVYPLGYRFIQIYAKATQRVTRFNCHISQREYKRTSRMKTSMWPSSLALRNWTIQSSGEFQSTVWTHIPYDQVE